MDCYEIRSTQKGLPMDNSVIQLIARLKIRLRQDQGLSLNTQRFFCDIEYAQQLLDLAEESSDIEVVETALSIRNRLGWLDTGVVSPSEISTPVKTFDKSNSARYRFGARS